MTKRSSYLLIFVLCLFLVSSCTANKQNDGDSNAYPIPPDATIPSNEVDEAHSAYPSGETQKSQSVDLPEDLDIPAPSSETAVVYGTLLSLSQDNAPYIAPSLFLGSIITSEDENSIYLGSISIEDDPMAQQASNGKFVFIDIQPGNYGLFIWTPVSAFIIKDKTNAQPVIVEVKPGQTYDLGTIYVP